MSDTTVQALNDALKFYRERRDNAIAVVTQLESTLAVLSPNPPPTAKREAPVRKAKQEKPAKAIPRKGSRPYTSDDVVDTAVELIRKSGPQPITAITAAVYGKFAKAKMSVSTALIQNSKKKKGARVEKTPEGLWRVIAAEKQGRVVHGPEEAEKLLAQARANAFNQPTSDIRA